jgi:short-subunit dehydrogenase
MKEQIVIIGGSKGLGFDIAKSFFKSSLQVTIISRSYPDSSKGECFNHIECDLEKVDNIPFDLIEKVKKYGAIRYIVFCQRLRSGSDNWNGELQVSLTATKFLIDGLLTLFSKEGDKSIVIVSSPYATHVGTTQSVSYHVAKAGLNAMARYYSVALKEYNIRVNSIMPLTYIKNENKEYLMSKKDVMQQYSDLVPLGRIGHSKDSVSLVKFLCSKQSSFITGQSIYVDGGVSSLWPEAIK